MKISIGKVQSDGTVLYISLLHDNYFHHNRKLLKRFYSSEKRVNALLALGNLSQLNASPYGKRQGYDDVIHCIAMIRDQFEAKKKHCAKICDSKNEFAKIGDHGFLWENGVWFLVRSGHIELLETAISERDPDPNQLRGLDVKTVKSGELETDYDNSVNTREDIQRKADEKQAAFFLFKGHKLIQKFNPNLKSN